MSLFCKHEWEVIVKTVAPKPYLQKVGGCSESLLERLTYGVTTVLLQCKKCPELRKEEMLGAEQK
jgi:hypothetical protein